MQLYLCWDYDQEVNRMIYFGLKRSENGARSR